MRIKDLEPELDAIVQERVRQGLKWGEQNHDDKTWLAILTEEVGELAQAILHDEFGGRAAGTARTELVQVAAVAVQWLECMTRRGTAVRNSYQCVWTPEGDSDAVGAPSRG